MKTPTLLLLACLLCASFAFAGHTPQSVSAHNDVPKTAINVVALNLAAGQASAQPTAVAPGALATRAAVQPKDIRTADTKPTANSSRNFKRKFFQRHLARKGAKRHPDLLAILSLGFGVAGMFFGLGIAAIVTGHLALRRGQRRGFAIAGLVLGYLKLLFWTAYFAVFIAFFLL